MTSSEIKCGYRTGMISYTKKFARNNFTAFIWKAPTATFADRGIAATDFVNELNGRYLKDNITIYRSSVGYLIITQRPYEMQYKEFESYK